MIDTPMQEIMEILGVDTEKEAIQRVEALVGENNWLNITLNSLMIVPVVIANGRVLFAQMPPTLQRQDYPTEFLENVRDSLIDSALQMRPAIRLSKQGTANPVKKEE